MIKGYLANGLFGLGDRLLNSLVAEKLRLLFKENDLDVELYLPQENLAINDKNSFASSEMIADGDDAYLNETDFMIAVMDGVEIDSGVACEIGVATTLGKKVFGLFTDTRQQGRENQQKIAALIADGTENQFVYRNLYVVGKIKKSGGIYSDIDSLNQAILAYAKQTKLVTKA
ncbi:nucleoside 2-deoxyribosyltransferase [Caldibacillus lycopersici]|uniref:Nucleoside 2-deoxyribosyltransferase n=1 Tax=Perspicuibacillus lycopersici TaxID=1325689 RepID=A0AAE3LU16_9BACI|nr:nucleoside 2-deoxyribosyltransferase [Perspicuibacillus lycopersici]MCU9614953.1 nucleoside 2-deoxyribosyltransferase [Perspicuibacillus lycopersici]